MKRKLSISLSVCLLASLFPFGACKNDETATPTTGTPDNVLYVASWDEYIDMGGEDSYLPNSEPLYDEFEVWYKQVYGEDIRVEYSALQDNETMYGKIKMGDKYDLLCPSEYMMMKLKAEDKLETFPQDFFDPAIEHNYYAQNLSPYIKSVFDAGGWTNYIAGYMWGTTGFVFNPKTIAQTEEKSREIMKSWQCLTAPECSRKITAKDNVRDSYFMGLGMYYENELLLLKDKLAKGEIDLATYKSVLSQKMNDTSVETMSGAKKKLEQMRRNLYGLETDEGKLDVISGRLQASYQWSGDAVFILDEAESEDENRLLEYSIPETASNLWFDGWVMMKGMSAKKQQIALAFINFLSRPDNVIRNMYYIGYTSCIGGEDVFGYIDETYSADETETDVTEYDLSYFFGDGYEPLTVETAQTRRQLFAQYPDKNTINRLVVMNYFDKDANERANRMWNNIK